MKKRKVKSKITVNDYIKAVKKADRETQLQQNAGWVRVNKIHKSKKAYDRRVEKKKNKDEYNI